MERVVKIRAVQALVALIALFFCTATAFAQPVAPAVTQVQACGHWAEPLTIEIPADRRVSIGRIAELIAEDVSNAQFQTALPVASGELPFRRTSTRSPRSMHAISLTGLVASIYTGDNTQVRAAIIARLREIVQRAGMTYTSIEEKRFCCLSRSSSGERLCGMPVNMACEDGSTPRLVSRNRYVRMGFRDNFLTESFVSGDSFDRSSWRGTPGYNFRVFLKPGRRPFVMNVARVYDGGHRPRPAAALCRELPLLATAAPPTDAAAKERIFARMAELTAATIAEHDFMATIWATQVVRDVSVRVADLEALSRAERQTADRDRRLSMRWAEIQHVRTVLARADGLKARWQKIATIAVIASIIAIIVSIFIGVYARRKAVEREVAEFIASLESELFAWTQFVHSNDSGSELVLGLKPGNIAEQLFKSGKLLEFLRLVREKTQRALDEARNEVKAYSQTVLDIVGQDNMAAMLRLSIARSENSGQIIIAGSQKSSPLTAPRARDLLHDLVQQFWIVDTSRAKLQQLVQDRDELVRSLVDGIHTALGAKTLEEVRLSLEEVIIATLRGDTPTLKRSLVPGK